MPISLYLARTLIKYPYHYFLRISYFDEDKKYYRSQQIAELGENPDQFIIYPNERSFYIAEELQEIASRACGRDSDNELEKLLWPFVDAPVKREMEPFFHRGQGRALKPMSKTEKSAIDQQLHLFDKRRLYFLRYGAVDQSRLSRMSPRACRPILNKSRDEIEQFFLTQEQELFEDEVKLYLFAAFNLQQHFDESYARAMPEALDESQVDQYFLDDICALAKDNTFWRDLADPNRLSPYLSRYIIYFFDLKFGANKRTNEYIRQFLNDHRNFKWPENQKINDDEISQVFGATIKELREMGEKELTSLWRQKAKELHPDTGGDHEHFVKLTAAYRALSNQD